MRTHKLIGAYSFLLGSLVLAMWAFLLFQGKFPEGKIQLSFHLYAEFAMAVICIVSGIMFWFNKPAGRETNMAGHAMVVYSVINAAGYYGELGNWLVVAMFLALFVISVTILSVHSFYFKRQNLKNQNSLQSNIK